MNVDERIAELTQKMLRRKFYAVLSQPSETPEKLKALLPAHLEYMIGLEKRGVLFASGPLADGEGPPSGAGLTILRAASALEARALAEADPICRQRIADLRTQGMDDHGGDARIAC
jgi:uncharacterized protein YciI